MSTGYSRSHDHRLCRWWVPQPGHLLSGTQVLNSVTTFWLCREDFWKLQPGTSAANLAAPLSFSRRQDQSFLSPPPQTTDSSRKETAPRSPDRKLPLRAKRSLSSRCKARQSPIYTKPHAIPNSPPARDHTFPLPKTTAGSSGSFMPSRVLATPHCSDWELGCLSLPQTTEGKAPKYDCLCLNQTLLAAPRHVPPPSQPCTELACSQTLSSFFDLR